MTRGRFEGLTDAQWQIIDPLLPTAPETKSMESGTCDTLACSMHTGLSNSVIEKVGYSPNTVPHVQWFERSRPKSLT